MCPLPIYYWPAKPTQCDSHDFWQIMGFAGLGHTWLYNDYSCNSCSFCWHAKQCEKPYMVDATQLFNRQRGRKRCYEATEDKAGIHILWHGSTFQGVRSFARISGRCCGEKSALQSTWTFWLSIAPPICWLRVWHQIYAPYNGASCLPPSVATWVICLTSDGGEAIAFVRSLADPLLWGIGVWIFRNYRYFMNFPVNWKNRKPSPCWMCLFHS